MPRDLPARAKQAGCPVLAAEYVVLGGRLSDEVADVVEALARGEDVRLLTTVLFTGLTDLKGAFDACLGLARARPEQAARITRAVADADRLFFGGEGLIRPA